jgi:hypothetical protein
MKTRRGSTAAALAAALLVFAAGGLAQEKATKSFATRGAIELGGSLSYSATWTVSDGVTSNDPIHLFGATPYVGYFVIDGLEVGANPLGVTYISQGSSHVTELKLLGSVAYNFKTPTRIFPFLEGLAGYSWISSSSSTDRGGFTWGGRGGIKVPVAAGALLNVGVQYLQVTLNHSGAPTRTGYNELGAVAGFTVWL